MLWEFYCAYYAQSKKSKPNSNNEGIKDYTCFILEKFFVAVVVLVCQDTTPTLSFNCTVLNRLKGIRHVLPFN